MSRSRTPNRRLRGGYRRGWDPIVGWVESKYMGNDFTNGHRGQAHAVAGAKKFVRSRTRARLKQIMHHKSGDEI